LVIFSLYTIDKVAPDPYEGSTEVATGAVLIVVNLPLTIGSTEITSPAEIAAENVAI